VPPGSYPAPSCWRCSRAQFGPAKRARITRIVISWDDKRSCLMFEEQNRPDATHTQKGQVYVPDGKPFMSLITVDKGALRMILVARPEGGLARGLITTLSNPGGMNFTPASAPLVLRRVAAQTPQLGYVHPGRQDYDRYLGELASVTPPFGGFKDVRATSTRTNTTPDDAVRLAVVAG
jgi:hypothetical protein